MQIKLIIGLRNPGAAYAQTRHNAGGWFAEALVKAYNTSFNIEKKLQGEIADIDVDNQRCKVLLPLSFMNHSGLPVYSVCQFYRIEPNEILVAHDELDLPVGDIKLKTGGGHGGHNGLRDIIQQLGHTDFHRLRIGIGHPGHKDLVLDYVLGKPSIHDRQIINDAVERSITVVPQIVSGRMDLAMNNLHG